MWINKSEFVTDVYPFVNQAADTAFSDRIAITLGGRVRWNREDWTPESAAEYLGKMEAAFAKAFELAKGK